MTVPSSFTFSLACGVAGAWVDVTSDVLFEEGNIPYTDGRTSQFDGLAPGVFSFTLKNGDGKYTPDNPLSSLATRLSEDMGACMEVAGMLVSGTIRNIALVFPTSQKNVTAARVRITVDDALGSAARHALGDLFDTALAQSSPQLFWELSDAAGSTQAGESITSTPPLSVDTSGGGSASAVQFGVVSNLFRKDVPVVAISPNGVAAATLRQKTAVASPIAYGQATLGWYSFWSASDATGRIGGTLGLAGGAVGSSVASISFTQVGGAGGVYRVSGGLLGSGGNNVVLDSPAATTGRAHHVSVEVTTAFVSTSWQITINFWFDGVLVGSGTSIPATPIPFVTLASDASRAPTDLSLQNTATTGVTYYTRLLHSLSRPKEAGLMPTTAADRLTAIATTTPEITLDTLPAMSPALLGEQSGGSTLSALGGVIQAEQGYMWAETTGTITAPVQKIKVLGRNRYRPVDYTFDVSEIQDRIPFVRSLANTVGTFTADGPVTSATFTDPTLGSGSSSDSVTLRDYPDLYAYASDRVARGDVHGVPLRAITINAQDPLISRWADLTAVRQGHRITITGLPATQLGYSTWDAYVVGREFVATDGDQKTFLFTFYLAAWTNVGVFDASSTRYSTGGTITLQSNINSSALSMGLVSTGALFTTNAAHFPQNLTIGDEVVTVSAVSGASSPQTATITARGVTGGSAAKAHTAGEFIDVSPLALYDF